jgi:hypothetical protein
MKNGEHLCTVGSEDVWMFSASVWGDIWGPEASFLDVSGGSKRRPDGESDFLIWGMPHELTKLDRITFIFQDGTASSPKGSVFDPKALPPEEPKFNISTPPTDEDLTILESRPALNRELTWLISLNGSMNFELEPENARQYVRLSMYWNEDHPQRMRISLSKSSLREISSRNRGEEIISESIPLDSTIEIAVGSNFAINP